MFSSFRSERGEEKDQKSQQEQCWGGQGGQEVSNKLRRRRSRKRGRRRRRRRRSSRRRRRRRKRNTGNTTCTIWALMFSNIILYEKRNQYESYLLLQNRFTTKYIIHIYKKKNVFPYTFQYKVVTVSISNICCKSEVKCEDCVERSGSDRTV